jgi:hypothetical protein
MLYLFACLLLVSTAFALPAPRSIQGSPMITSRQFQLGCGSATYHFVFPADWGMGECSTSGTTGTGHFTVFPVRGGVGCTMDIRRFETVEQLQGELERIRGTFSATKNLPNGFEAEVPSGWYAAQQHGTSLVEVWYILPRKTPADRNRWPALRDCVTVSELEPKSAEPEATYLPLEKTREGWVYHHPDHKLHVLFESRMMSACAPVSDLKRRDVLHFKDTFWEGFFYIKWNQASLDTAEPYRAHLKEMLADLRMDVPQQVVYGDPEFDSAGGYAVSQGSPYTLISCSGNDDPFLFGIALRPKMPFAKDMNEIIHKVKWYQTP